MNKQQTIQREKHKRDYLVVGNSLAQNENLSYEARGMLIELLSRPDDWKVHVSTLQRKGCGRDKVTRILNELIEAGYITGKKRIRNDDGTFGYTPYMVHEKPLTENPSTVEPSTANPHLQSTDVHSTKDMSSSDDASIAQPDSDTSSKPKASSKTNTPTMDAETRERWFVVCRAIGGYGDDVPFPVLTNMYKLFLGQHTKGEWKKYQPSKPITIDEAEQMATWQQSHFDANIKHRTPEGLTKLLADWRQSKAQRDTPRPQRATFAPDYNTDDHASAWDDVDLNNIKNS